MPRLEEKPYTYFTTVRGMCRTCREIVPARVFFRDGQVWQESLCPTCKNEPALIAADGQWYLSHAVGTMPDCAPLSFAIPPKNGCPHDCGPCTWHASPCQLPIFSITNDCELRCPICFTYNRADRIYHVSLEEMQKTVDWIVTASGRVDLINLTGGEPTRHPQLIDILRICQRPEIGRITMNSNGLRLAEDYSLCEQLAELGVYVILSLNTFDPVVSIRLHGRDLTNIKRQAIDNLDRAGVRMTLLNVMIRGENETAIAGIGDLMRNHENILSLTVQTMAYTGQGGGQFTRQRHIPVDEAARIVAQQFGGELSGDDFFGRPSAHPLCYRLCYLLKDGGQITPLARLASSERIASLLRDSYLIRPENDVDFFTDMINDLYAEGETGHLATLRKLVERLYPSGKAVSDFERQKIAESAVRTIYVHSHMDEDTFDCSRAMLCPDLVPAEPGRLIPACTYNLFYRQKDERFYVEQPS
jgi:7,8-dihydro-6-hydroxymethylpterin dimethyltransferase